MKNKQILVTGGAGFIGSHLCELLLTNGNGVICADNFFTGDKRNIENLLENKNFELIRHDITFPLYLEIDQIYNFACPASPVHYQYDPVQTIKTSVHGSINMLGLAKRTKARIFQASTSEVYGNPTVHPQSESYVGSVNPIGPRACYDEGKRAAETLFFDYNRQHSVDIRVARIFNTYGPNMAFNDGRVISNLIIQAIKNKSLTIYGDGSQTRSFCYVDDLIEGIIRFMNQNEFLGPINMGNTEEISISELADKIIDMTNSKSEISYKTIPQDDPLQRQPDISLAKTKLKWKPSVNLDKGLEKTINYFESIVKER